MKKLSFILRFTVLIALFFSISFGYIAEANNPPAQVTGIAGTTYTNQVRLQWNQVSDATDYIIEYKPASQTIFSIFPDGESSVTNAFVTGLVQNTAYDFRVSALNTFGTGTASVVKTLTPTPITALVSPTPTQGAILSTSTATIAASIVSSVPQQYRLALVDDVTHQEVAVQNNPTVQGAFNFDALVRTVTNQDLTVSEDNYSGISFVPTTETLFMVRNSRDQIKEYSTQGVLLRTITCSACGDIEGITLIASTPNGQGGFNHTFMISTEDAGKIFRVTIPSTGTTTVTAADFYNTGITHGTNLGLEGIAYNAQLDTYYVVREKTSTGVFAVSLGANNLASSSQICTNVNFGSYMTDMSDVTYIQNTLYVLSHESAKVVALDISNPTNCQVTSQLTGISMTQAEGLVWDPTGNTLWLLGESDFLTVYQANNKKYQTTFNNILPGTYRVIAHLTDIYGVVEQAPYTTFTVQSAPPVDTTAPTISSVVVTLGVTTATITWNTNELTTSYIRYGLTTSYNLQATSTGSIAHSVTLTGLTANTRYNYRIYATDPAGNTSSTANARFTTKRR
jgi:uncharacterized protein YjiK